MPATKAAYAPSARAHSETVLRSFYEFHRVAGTGPIVNPFPLERARQGGRVNAHHHPMEPYRKQRTGLYRPRVPKRVPRSICPDSVQRARLVEIRGNLLARIAEAEREGWPGEVEGLHVSLAGAEDKLAQVDAKPQRKPAAAQLGIPSFA